MKKLMSLLLMLALLFAVPAWAEGDDWFEISDSGEVLTLRLPADGQWQYEISDTAYLDMLTMETVDGMWVASFASVDSDGAEGIVTLRVVNDAADTAEKQGRELEIHVDGMKRLSVQQWRMLPEEEQWYSLFDPAVLSVKLPVSEGYVWSCTVSDEAVLETVSAQTVYNGPVELIRGMDSTFAASFRGLQPGAVELCLDRVAPEQNVVERRVIVLEVGEDMLLSMRVTELYLAQDGHLVIEKVETFPEEETWYTLEDPMLLTVCLPVDGVAANPWTVDISDPAVLEIASEEMMAYKDANGAYAVSFRGLQPGSVRLTFVNTAAQANDMTVERILQINVTEDLHIAIAEMMNTK